MNMLRIPGTSAYESGAFYDLCDELGLLVWQDFMFANLDYPIADERFRQAVTLEAEAVVAELAGRPSLNRAVRQQARSSSRWRCSGSTRRSGAASCFGELLPRLAAEGGQRRRVRFRLLRAAETCRSGPTAESPTTTASAATGGR